MDEERIPNAEELFNCKIEVLNLTTADQFIARIMAGDSTYDILREKHRVIHFPLVTKGMLFPVGDLLPQEHYDALTPMDRYSIEKLQYQDTYWGFGPYEGIFNDSMMLFAYNRDLIASADQPDPYELWKEDKWTYDAFEQICIATTKDTNGDGVIDQFGMTGMTGSPAIFRFAPSNGVELAKQVDGRWIFSFDTKEAMEVLNTMKRWNVDLGLMGGNFAEGTAVFNSTHLPGIRNATNINYGLVPLPKGPSAERYYYPVFQLWQMSLPINAERSEDLMALGCYLFRTDDSYIRLDLDINAYITTKEQYDVYNTGMEEWKGEGDIFQNTDLWTIVGPGAVEAVAGSKGAASAMDEIRPQAQAYLDDLFGQ